MDTDLTAIFHNYVVMVLFSGRLVPRLLPTFQYHTVKH